MSNYIHKTKYRNGQWVWFMLWGKPVRLKIFYTILYPDHIAYETIGYGRISESTLFPSKAAALGRNK
jgi:hypothetical protein